jgi:N-acetylglucosaminyl-diphospho-decaprenol L-rhamnosyltransferase
VTASLDIVIVNWNTGQCLRDCLASIELAAEGRDVKLLSVRVVDNASTDGSAKDLEASAIPLTVIRNRENIGFARACNQGAMGRQADYLLLLNPDVVLRRDTLSTAVACLERAADSGYGICGVKLLDDSGHVFPSCARFPTPVSLLGRTFGLDRLGWSSMPSQFLSPQEHSGTRQVDQVSGAFFLLHGALFDRLMGFDERFFVYYEELDFALRARRVGVKSLFTDDAVATHHGGVSSGQVIGERTAYSLRSRVLYSYKHFGRAWADAVLADVLVVEPLFRGLLAVATCRWRSLGQVIRATRLLWTALPELRSARARSGPRGDEIGGNHVR